ncbi:MAG TPA: hypothetical protein VLX92_19960 [Kofleriaceae bacterium]|nr:hypothetical protein [Kofleriaceae bacterium]
MAARLFLSLAVVLAFGCKKKPAEEEPAPQPTGTAGTSGHSVTKIKDDGSGSATGSAGSGSAGGKPLAGVTAVSVGGDRACAIADEKLYCWDKGAPAEMMEAPDKVKLVAGAQCAALDDMSVWCWPHTLKLSAAGRQVDVGQLAASATDICASFRLFTKCWKPGDDAPRVEFDWAGLDLLAVGNGRVCSVVSGGDVECTPTSSPKPQQIHELEDIAAIALQDATACTASTKGGAVECWVDARSRTPVPGVTGASALAIAPSGDACALTGSGAVTCWKLSLLSGQVSDAPRPIAGLGNAVAIGVGNGFGCAATQDKKAVCWNDGEDKPTPVVAK